MRVETEHAYISVIRGIDDSSLYDGLVVWRDDGGNETVQLMIKNITIMVNADIVRKVLEKGRKK